MYSQKQYRPPFIVIIFVSFFSSCFSSYQDYPFVRKPSFGSMSESLPRIYRARASAWSRNVVNVDDFEAKGYGTDDSQAMHPFVRKPSFGSMSESLPRTYQARASASSRNVVNVDDFGAKGYGTDDSKAMHPFVRKPSFGSVSESLPRTYQPSFGRTYQPSFGSVSESLPRTYQPSIGSMSESWPRIYRARASASPRNVVNVDDFGAKGYGTYDSKAFKEAWEEACSSKTEAVLIVPKNRVYHLEPVTFSGPCKSDLTMKIYGTIKATNRVSDYDKDPRHWLVFQNLNNFRVEGGGTIDGNGKIWWIRSCKVNKALPCEDAPNAVTFLECNNLRVGSLRFRNSQKMHVAFQDCVNVEASNLRVIAPGNSPNTDGIHVTGTQNIQIKNCIIRTGDDCISIVSGSRNVRATDITCGPGHGISIGSLGAGNSEAIVSNVMVNRARLSGTTNGMRIKTWQGGSGYAKNIVFQNVLMYNVTNPIIIDQHYCDQEAPCPEQASAVKISNVMYKNIRGTSASEVAIKLDCSRQFPCQGLVFQDVILGREVDEIAKASCSNVYLSTRGNFSPRCI